MENLIEQKEGNESDQISNPHDKDQCILEFRCSHCEQNMNTIKKNTLTVFPNSNNDDICPSCKYKFTKCSVCLCPIKLNSKSNNANLVFCNKCFHGGHYNHYKGWFKEFNECPNSQCDCLCQKEET